LFVQNNSGECQRQKFGAGASHTQYASIVSVHPPHLFK
jgi:hypothetical protein